MGGFGQRCWLVPLGGGGGVVEGLMAKVKTGKCSTLFFFLGVRHFTPLKTAFFLLN